MVGTLEAVVRRGCEELRGQLLGWRLRRIGQFAHRDGHGRPHDRRGRPLRRRRLWFWSLGRRRLRLTRHCRPCKQQCSSHAQRDPRLPTQCLAHRNSFVPNHLTPPVFSGNGRLAILGHPARRNPDSPVWPAPGEPAPSQMLTNGNIRHKLALSRGPQPLPSVACETPSRSAPRHPWPRRPSYPAPRPLVPFLPHFQPSGSHTDGVLHFLSTLLGDSRSSSPDLSRLAHSPAPGGGSRLTP